MSQPHYISKAPGRICLFGDHQDYLELPIIACAIDRFITIEAKPNQTDFFKILKKDLNETETILISESLDTISESDYLRLALRVLSRYNCVPNQGFDISISGNIPINAGLSSSSALTVAWIQFMVHAFGIHKPITPELIAQLAYETEVLEQGTSGGKMDHYAIAIGNTIYMDTRNDKVENISHPIKGLIIGVSGDAKDTLGNLAMLKEKAWQAINEVKARVPEFDIATMKAAKFNDYKALVSSDLQPIFEAAVKNYLITKKAQNVFGKSTTACVEIGDLMNQHHQLLKDNLHITTPRIDAMIDAALASGAYGAKIVGSGGGGCIVALSPQGKEKTIIEAIKKAGAEDAFMVNQSPGAHITMKA